MARIDLTGFEDALAEMRKRGEQSGPVALALLGVGAAAAVESWRETITRLGLVDTGAMRDSIAPSAPKDNGGILYREITAKGTDAKGTRNGEKAFILHYGTSRIKASYWWDTAERDAEPKVTAAMTAAWNSYTETGDVPAAAAEGVFTSTAGRRRRSRSK